VGDGIGVAFAPCDAQPGKGYANPSAWYGAKGIDYPFDEFAGLVKLREVTDSARMDLLGGADLGRTISGQ
jgi:hypothetical protein